MEKESGLGWPQAVPVPLPSRRGDPRPAHLWSPAPWPLGRCRGSGPDTATAAVDVDPELRFQVETTDISVLRTLEGCCPSRFTPFVHRHGSLCVPASVGRGSQPPPQSRAAATPAAPLAATRWHCCSSAAADPSCQPGPPPRPVGHPHSPGSCPPEAAGCVGLSQGPLWSPTLAGCLDGASGRPPCLATGPLWTYRGPPRGLPNRALGVVQPHRPLEAAGLILQVPPPTFVDLCACAAPQFRGAPWGPRLVTSERDSDPALAHLPLFSSAASASEPPQFCENGVPGKQPPPSTEPQAPGPWDTPAPIFKDENTRLTTAGDVPGAGQ